jgi:hypothetical protein
MLPNPSREIEELTASARMYLLKEVGTTLKSWVVDDIGKAGEDFDLKLCLLVEEFLAGVVLPRLARGRAFQKLPNRFDVDGKEFEVRVQGDIWSPDTVNIAVIARSMEHPPSKPDPETVTIKGPGLYHRANLFLPTELQTCKEGVSQVLMQMFNTGYTLLREEIRRCCSDERISAAALYRRLRILIADDDLSADVWLVAFEKGEGIYLLDSTVVDNALERVSSVSGNLGASPALFVGGLLNVVLPLELALSRIAIERGECIVVSLEDSPYRENYLQFLTAEKALYGGSEIAIFPILCEEDKSYFVSVFPASKRKQLEAILISHQEDLSQEFKAFRSRLTKLIRRLKDATGTLNPQWWGAFLGSTLTSAVKTLAD